VTLKPVVIAEMSVEWSSFVVTGKR
jgi:hypothetical protein